MPGVPGIGVKTAAQLINEYGDLETLLARAGEIKQDKRRQSLLDNADLARVSQRLVTLVEDVPLETPLEALAAPGLDAGGAIAFLKAMEFTTLTRRIAEDSGTDASADRGGPAPQGPGGRGTGGRYRPSGRHGSARAPAGRRRRCRGRATARARHARRAGGGDPGAPHRDRVRLQRL